MIDRTQAIRDIVSQYGPTDPKLITNPTTLPLALPSFGQAEIVEAMDALLSGWLTMGNRVFEFERRWAEYIGTKEAIAVNSGSSALLVMLSAMIECGYLKRGQEVIVPAVGWSTSLFSVAQAGLTPVLVDVDPETLSLSGQFEEPVLAIHMLGNPARVETPWLLEDSCGAHGAEVDGQKTGSIGHCGAFSFFFSHHITTGEGGSITTNDSELADACRSIRAHGWVRERTDRAVWETNHPQIDPRFLFASMGYNVRMTEISGAIGMHQIDRIEGFVLQRRNNHQRWCEMVNALSLPLRVYPEAPNTRHAGFAFPMMLDEDAPITRANCVQNWRKDRFKRVRYQVPTWQYNLLLTRYPIKRLEDRYRLQLLYKKEDSLLVSHTVLPMHTVSCCAPL